MNFKPFYEIKPTPHGDIVVVFFMNIASFVWMVRGFLVFIGIEETTFAGVEYPLEPWVYMLPFPLTMLATSLTIFLVMSSTNYKIIYGLPMCFAGILLVSVHNFATGDTTAAAQLMYVPFIMQAAHVLRLEGTVIVSAFAVFANGFVLYLHESPRQFITDTFGTAVPMLLVAFVLVAMSHTEFSRTEAIKKLAYTDILTGLQNRSMLEQELITLSNSINYKSQITLALIDIDFFKEINDTFGHHIGDKVLIDTSESLREIFQSGETLIRMGGDELAVLFPQASSNEAKQKIKTFVENSKSTIEGTKQQASFSIGIASLPEHVPDIFELYGEADAALYAAKRGGRSRIVVAGDDTP